MFFRRFYTQSTLSQHDPALIAVTALLIAAKVEECAVNAKALVKQVQPASSSPSSRAPMEWSYGVSDVLDCEFVLLHALLFDLIVFHPYRPLVHFLSSFQSHERYTELVQHSWELVNDSYYSDVVMLYPPYVVAISCLYMAAHMLNVDYRAWIRAIATPQQLVADCTHQMLQHIDRREQMEKEKADEIAAAGSAAEWTVDVFGCLLDRRLREALERLQEHHQTRRSGKVGATEQRVEEDKGGDKDEKMGEDAAVDSADVAAADAVVILEDAPELVSVRDNDTAVTEEAREIARKKQKVEG